MPPPERVGDLTEPARARPVPFCRYSLAVEPETSPRVRVEAVPRRRAACSARTARCSRLMSVATPKRSTLSLTSSTRLPAASTTVAVRSSGARCTTSRSAGLALATRLRAGLAAAAGGSAGTASVAFLAAAARLRAGLAGAAVAGLGGRRAVAGRGGLGAAARRLGGRRLGALGGSLGGAGSSAFATVGWTSAAFVSAALAVGARGLGLAGLAAGLRGVRAGLACLAASSSAPV